MNTKKILLEVGFWLFCGLYLYLYIKDPLQRLGWEDDSTASSEWLIIIFAVAYILVYKRDIDPEKKKIYKRSIVLCYPLLLCLLYFFN
ncbi:MAG TPA: hypothetical protein DCX97_05395 [Alistipes sp.]|nr:hypothetical protein [Alistipes sp.]